MPAMDLVFFDTETTGLQAEQNGIIEIACVRTSPDASKILDEFQTKIVLEPNRYQVDAKALEVNGYSAEKWASANTLEFAMSEVLRRMPWGVQLAGHNVAFDLAFLKASVRRAGLRVPNFYSFTVDTMTLSQPLLVKGHIPNQKLITLSKFFNLAHDDAHTALGDVKATIGVYRAILGFYPEVAAPATT